MPREVVEPTKDEEGWERHPAWGMIGASRIQAGPPGTVLFDSEIRHGHYVSITLVEGARKRELNRDWLHGEKRIVQVDMSEAQWASFVSSMGRGAGVACTITSRESQMIVPDMPFEPRLQESMDEVRGAADKALEKIREAFEVAQERPNKGNMRALGIAIANAPSNMTFAAKSMTEHTENVVQKARADLEAMVAAKAQQLGLEPADLGEVRPALSAGDHETGDGT
jgi:hypothetical protein